MCSAIKTFLYLLHGLYIAYHPQGFDMAGFDMHLHTISHSTNNVSTDKAVTLCTLNSTAVYVTPQGQVSSVHVC
jgi:hypothetical protein